MATNVWIELPGVVPGTIANEIIVQQNPSSGQYASIATALASITTASPSSPFIINVGPGIYVEPQLVMKSYVSITAETPQEAILTPINPGEPFLIGADSSSLNNIVITGASEPGGVGIQYTGGSASSSFLVDNCVFGNCETLAYAQGNASFETIFIIKNSISFPDVVFTDGFRVDAQGGVRSRFVIDGLFINAGHSSAAPEDFIEVSGDGAKLFITSSFFIGPFSSPDGNALHLSDGADVAVLGCNFINMDKCIWVENVGLPSELDVVGAHTDSNNVDIQIDHPTTTGTINGAFDPLKTSSASQLISLFLDDPAGGLFFTGNMSSGDTYSQVTNISPIFQDQATSGALDPVIISSSGLDITIPAGDGYIQIGNQPDNYLKYVTWATTVITVPTNSSKFIYVNSSGTVLSADSSPDIIKNVFLGAVVSDSSSVYIKKETSSDAFYIGNKLDDFIRNALGPVYQSGSLVAENATPRKLDVGSGTYYFSTHKYQPSGGSTIQFYPFYRDGSGGYTKAASTDSLAASSSTWKYDNGTGTLANITGTNYARYSLYVVGEGASELYMLVYGQTLYSTLVAAEGGTIPTAPTFFDENVVLIASIIVQQGQTSIVEIVDERPVIGFKAAGVTATAVHGNLLGLLADDHPQYLLVAGSRAMSGNLNLGTNNITNIGTITANVLQGVNASNQLALGTGNNQFILNGGTSANPRTYTVPDNGTTSNLVISNSGSSNQVAYWSGTGVLTGESTLSISRGGTGSATQNFVDLSTNQSIAGNKTFSGTTSATGPTLLANAAGSKATIGAASSAQVHAINGGLGVTVRSSAANFTIDTTTTDLLMFIDTSGGAVTVTLPAPTPGRLLILKDSTGRFAINNCTLARNGSEKIEGLAASKVLSTAWGAFTITSNGTDWFMI